MPDLKDFINDKPEDERIRKWREERHRVAEVEKAERIRRRDEARAAEALEQAKLRKEEAARLLPTNEDITSAMIDLERARTRDQFRTLLRFGMVCLVPVVATFVYLVTVATPLYEARSVIAVTSPAIANEATQSGILGSLNSPGNLQEVFMAHEFIQSKAIMDRLEASDSLVSDLSSSAVDPLQRLRNINVLSYGKHDQFGRFVESSVDIQTGLITLFVRTPDPSRSVKVSETILAMVADQVNTLNADVIAQKHALANQSLSAAQQQLTDAQTALTKLQLESGVADPAERIASVYTIINHLEEEAITLGNDIQRADVAGLRDTFQTQRTVALQERIQMQIAEQRALLVQEHPGRSAPLNTLMLQHQLAALQVSIAEEALTVSVAAQADTTQAATLARSLFQVVVPPTSTDIATSPNKPKIIVSVLIGTLALFAFWSVTFAGRRAA